MIDLKQYCDKSSERLSKPHFLDGKWYASDGKILIVADENQYSGDHFQNHVFAKQIQSFEPTFKDVVRVALPDVASLEKCFVLRGRRIVKGRIIKCPHCNRDPECWECGGNGKVDASASTFVPLEGYKSLGLAAKNIHLINLLPDVEFFGHKEDINDRKPFEFKFKGGCGVAMPMLKRKEVRRE